MKLLIDLKPGDVAIQSFSNGMGAMEVEIASNDSEFIVTRLSKKKLEEIERGIEMAKQMKLPAPPIIKNTTWKFYAKTGRAVEGGLILTI